jgi:hypothetical protein
MIKYNKEYITRRNYMDLKEMQRVLDKNKEVIENIWRSL